MPLGRLYGRGVQLPRCTISATEVPGRVSLDGVYDGSASVIPTDPISVGAPSHRSRPSIRASTGQIALGISARGEVLVMPYFNIGIGLRVNVL